MTQNSDLWKLTITEAASLIQSKQISPVDLIKSHLERIENTEKQLNSFISVLSEKSLVEAKVAEKEISSGNYKGPLHGMPLGIKDLFHEAETKTTAGSKIYGSDYSTETSYMVSQLKADGAITIGKTQMHEFGMGATSLNPHYGPSRNPWDTSKMTGGSSGGSGSSVASRQSKAAIGSDTGGSVRIPSALCGIVGIKPTFGMISRSASFAMSWSQDTPGPMTQNVTDCAIMLKSIAKHDPSDYNSAKFTPVDYYKNLKASVDNIRIGIPDSFFFDIVDEEVKKAVLEAANVLNSLGAEIFDVKLELIEKSLDISTIIINAEASEIHEKDLENHASELDPGSRWRIELGNFVSAVDYIKAQRARSAFVKGLNTTFEKVDLLLTPTMPVLAPGIDETEILIQGKKEDPLPLLSRLTRPFNLSGHPAISLPCGFSNSGLPIGLQLVAPYFKEQSLLDVGLCFENATDWIRQPSL